MTAFQARSHSDGETNPTVTLVALFLLTVVHVAPIWLVSTPPLQDYPAHMARMHVLMTLPSDPFLRAFYEVSWEVIPNLAMDLLLPPVADGDSLHLAGRLFLSAVVAMWVTGPVALHCAIFGRISLWPLIASVFAYNQSLIMGFVNFSFGGGLIFFALAVWIRRGRLPMIARYLIPALFALAIFFSHFIAFGIYALTVVGYEAGKVLLEPGALRLRSLPGRAAGTLAQFVAPTFLFLFFSPTRSSLTPTGSIEWGGLESRLSAVRSAFWFENGAVDYMAFAFACAAFVWALATGSLRIDKPFVGALAALALAALAMPTGLDGPGLRHVRIPPVFGALIFATTRCSPGWAPRFGAALVAVGVAIALGRIATTATRWVALDAKIAEFRQATARIEQGARMFLVTVGPTGHSFRGAGGGALLHLADYATIDRSAFVPTVFADPGVQPIRHVPALRAPYQRARPADARWESLPERVRDDPEGGDMLSGWPGKFDYLVVLNLAAAELEAMARLEPFHTGSFFTIFAIDCAGGAATCAEPSG